MDEIDSLKKADNIRSKIILPDVDIEDRLYTLLINRNSDMAVKIEYLKIRLDNAYEENKKMLAEIEDLEIKNRLLKVENNYLKKLSCEKKTSLV